MAVCLSKKRASVVQRGSTETVVLVRVYLTYFYSCRWIGLWGPGSVHRMNECLCEVSGEGLL